MLGAYTRRDRDAVAADFERNFGYFPRLKERLQQQAGTLSGGEQQMLARLCVLDSHLPEPLDRTVHRLVLARPANGRAALRRSDRRRGGTDSARTAAPGRSSRFPGRAGGPSPARTATPGRRQSKRSVPQLTCPGGSISRISDSPVTDLPDPDSPTRHTTSPGAHVEIDPVHGTHAAHAGVSNVVTRLRTDSRKLAAAGHRRSSGFSLSCSQSPRTLTESTVANSTMLGTTTGQALMKM